jgi:hypothetical protein
MELSDSKGDFMIELSAEQQQVVRDEHAPVLPVIDPATQRAFVLIPRELYDSLTDYDDNPWTDEEMDMLAAEVDAMLDDDMAVEDHG